LLSVFLIAIFSVLTYVFYRKRDLNVWVFKFFNKGRLKAAFIYIFLLFFWWIFLPFSGFSYPSGWYTS
jgi:hypothetical protein